MSNIHPTRSFRQRLIATLTVVGATAAGVAAAGPAVIHADDGAAHASGVVVNAAGDEIGFVLIVEDGIGGVHVNIKVQGLTPGLHGAHLHSVGACSPSFGSAGSHHNPKGVAHGGHAGDLPNLVADAEGRGRLNAHLDGFTLTPGGTTLFDPDGTALIIHAGPDDYVTDPTGNSGGRVACAVITAG